MLGLQRDVAGAASLYFEQKRGKKRDPCRIGGGRCRVGSPTRRGRDRKPDFRAEKGPKTGSHVALEGSHVVLGVQRDVAVGVSLILG